MIDSDGLEWPGPTRTVPAFLPLLLAFAVGACAATAEDPPLDDETTGSTSATSTGGDSTGGSAPPPATTSSSSPDPGTTAPDDESSSSEDGGFIGRPDIGGGPAGICLGVTEVGHLATIGAATPDPVDLTCDPAPDGCGGDVVGTWTTVAHCGLDALPNFFEDSCPGSTMQMVGSEVEGTRTFEENGDYTVDASLVLDVEVVLDAMDCFGVECSTFGDLLTDEDNNVEAVCDTPEGGDCTCLMTITNAGTSSGTWAVEGDGLVLTFGGEAQDPVPLCVDGDRLEIWEPLHESRVYEETPCETAADCEKALGDAHETWYCLI